MSATCKDCHHKIRWAAAGGASLPFELTTVGPGTFQIYKAHGTDRARLHPGIGHPNVPAYRRHDCRKDQR